MQFTENSLNYSLDELINMNEQLFKTNSQQENSNKKLSADSNT